MAKVVLQENEHTYTFGYGNDDRMKYVEFKKDASILEIILALDLIKDEYTKEFKAITKEGK